MIQEYHSYSKGNNFSAVINQSTFFIPFQWGSPKGVVEEWLNTKKLNQYNVARLMNYKSKYTVAEVNSNDKEFAVVPVAVFCTEPAGVAKDGDTMDIKNIVDLAVGDDFFVKTLGPPSLSRIDPVLQRTRAYGSINFTPTRKMFKSGLMTSDAILDEPEVRTTMGFVIWCPDTTQGDHLTVEQAYSFKYRVSNRQITDL